MLHTHTSTHEVEAGSKVMRERTVVVMMMRREGGGDEGKDLARKMTTPEEG